VHSVQCPGADDIEVVTDLKGIFKTVCFKECSDIVDQSAHRLQIYQLILKMCVNYKGLDGQRFARCVLFFAFPQGNMAQIY
jgi:hypothetical protein